VLYKNLNRFRFGEFSLYPEVWELHRNGSKVAAGSQPVFLLAALLENPGCLVTREELTKKLWPTSSFAKNSLNVAVNAARRLLGDDLRKPQFIKTVGRKGYCFTHKVEILPVAPQTQRLSAAEGHYWKDKQLWEMRTPASLRESIYHFKESIKEDPSYALAYCGLADAYTMGAIHAIMPPKEPFRGRTARFKEPWRSNLTCRKPRCRRVGSISASAAIPHPQKASFARPSIASRIARLHIMDVRFCTWRSAGLGIHLKPFSLHGITTLFRHH